MERLIDLGAYPVRDVLPILLKDRTTEKNIIWAADTYEEYGEEYRANRCMRADLLMNGPTIQPRIAKNVDAQLSRTKKFAEVFTPSWLCNQMNNHCDEVWFGRKDVFNHMEGNEWIPTEGPIVFPKRKRWQRYVDSRRLEITCGEAPFLTSRYDAVTGESIPIGSRVGVLDRKLRVVNENAADEAEWWKYTYRAFESTYGYEYQGDNLLIARINLLLTFADIVWEKWQRQATAQELKRVTDIISWNIWQMDGLKGTVPFGSLQEANAQLSIWELLGEMCPSRNNIHPQCRICDWRGQGKLTYNDRKTRKGSEMKFDFVIGNPPYQADPELGSTRSLPVYDSFMDAAYIVSDKTLLITPARFLFNAGQTKKDWNEKMLNDPHFKVLYYESDSSKVFPTTDIAAGIAISYHDNSSTFRPIGTFVAIADLRSIIQKAAAVDDNHSIASIADSQNNYNFKELYADHPDYAQYIPAEGKHSQLKSNALMKVPIFSEEKQNEDDLKIYGLVDSKRTYRYCVRRYIRDTHPALTKYKVLIAKAGGSGKFGDTLSESIIAEPNSGFTQTFISIGLFDTIIEAENLQKYIKTKFCRTLLGVLKVTQDNPPIKWRLIPLQDFTPNSDIDWSVSIAEIDRQLYKKYNLSEAEINFIETKVKEMV